MERLLKAAMFACAAGALCGAAALCNAAAPPAAKVGYGVYQRTVEDLPDVRGAVIADDGTIYASLGSGGVVKVTEDGRRSTVIPWWPAGGVACAGALAAAPDGGVLLADTARAKVLRLAPDGTHTTIADLGLLSSPPSAVAVCALGNRFFVVDGAQPRVLALDASGTARAQWEIPAPKDGLVPRLRGIAASPEHIFVSDAANHRIVRMDPNSGQVTAAWGDRGAAPAMLESPAGLAWDGVGLLVTDTLNHRVIRFTAEGEPMDQWGMHAVRPREGDGKIHYPVSAMPSPNGSMVVVAEPFERRVQVFAQRPPPSDESPGAQAATSLPANQGIASHFSREVSVDGQTLLVYEPESASALVFDMRNEPPIHVTTLGGPGMKPGQFGVVTTQLVDERRNRLYLVDPMRGVIVTYALRRDGQAPHFDPFMGRLVSEVPLQPIASFAAQRTGGAPFLWPVDIVRTPSGGFALLDALGCRVIELDSGLKPVNAWGGRAGPGRLVEPTQMAVTPQGDVVVVDAAERALKRYALADGSLQGAIKLPEIKRPWGVAAVPSDTGTQLAVSDAGGDALCVIDPVKGGVIWRKVATGQRPGELWEPGAVALQSPGNRLYLSDHGNHRLQSFQADGTWESSFGLGRPFVRPRDPNAPQAPVTPAGVALTAEGAANTLAQFPPATKGDDGWWSASTADGKYRVKWRCTPAIIPLRDPFTIQVLLSDPQTGQPSEAALAVDAQMPHHGHGMNVAPTIARVAPGEWRVDNMLFHMPGFWQIHFDVSEGGRLERAQAEVNVE